MKCLLIVVALIGLSCRADNTKSLLRDEKEVEAIVHNLLESLKGAYAGAHLDTDSLLNAYYDADCYYVTPWGTSETLDSTRSRLRAAVPRMREFDFSIENLSVKSFGSGAFAFFILRQEYVVDGKKRDEYLPTTLVFRRGPDGWKIIHSHRSTDPETWKQWFGNTPP